MLGEFGYIGILLIVALLFPLGALVVSYMLKRFRIRVDDPNPVKNDTYECGVETQGPSWIQFNFRYYNFALLFVIFEVETVFLYPWAVAFRKLELFGLVEMGVFVAMLAIGLAYAWKKGAREWK